MPLDGQYSGQKNTLNDLTYYTLAAKFHGKQYNKHFEIGCLQVPDEPRESQFPKQNDSGDLQRTKKLQ